MLNVNLRGDNIMDNREQAIFLAKRLIVDSIWKSANLEGLGTTFPKTEMILENYTVSNTSREEVIFIVNMKRAWDFLIENIDYSNSSALLRELNKVVGNGLYWGNGEIRKMLVAIGGTDWIPSIPDEAILYDTIDNLEKIEDIRLKALKYFCFIARTQMFIDGNKRVAQLMANKVLIDGGIGIFQIPIKGIEEFKTILIDFYETNDDSKIIEFMKKYCIRGLDGKTEEVLVVEEKVNVFKDVDSREEFVLSSSQCRIMNGVLYNLSRLLRSYGLGGKFVLFEEDEDIYLRGDGFRFKYNYSEDRYTYKWDSSLNVDFDVLKEFIVKTIKLLNSRVPFSVKRVRFSIDSEKLTCGIMRDSFVEKGSIEMDLE